MFSHRYCIISAMIMAGSVAAASAQSLPKLPQAKEIVSGQLSDGIEYYLVTNSASHGYADYALVQKEALGEQKARGALLSLPRFSEQAPYRFLASRGVGYGSRGFVKAGRNSTIFRFEDVPTTDTATSDSTLMMIFDLCSLSDREQAIIISGDINADALKGKMSIFSMMIPQLREAPSQPGYEWNPKEYVSFSGKRNSTGSVAGIKVRYALPRTPRESLNTVQSYVNDMLYGELEVLLERRIREAMRLEGMPFANIRCDYRDSSRGSGDEAFSVSVQVERDRMMEALGILGRIFAGIDRLGVEADELDSAREAYLARLARQAAYETVTNAEYIDKCISAYLYGTRLSPLSHEVAYFDGKDMSGDHQAEVFSSFAAAVIDPSRNLTLTCTTPDGNVSEVEAVAAFQAGWDLNKVALRYDFKQHIAADTLWRDFWAEHKVKLKSEAAEPITGGTMLTFSNGLNVVYKQEAGRSDFNFALMVRGGYPYVKGLKAGEGAFVSDMMRLYEVGGVDCYDLAEMLRSQGVDINYRAGISDLRICGSAPAASADLVLRTLVKTATDSRSFLEGYPYYRSCELLRLDASHLEERGISAAVDSIMRPSYLYSPYKSADNLGEDLLAKCDPFFEGRYSSMGDGLIVLVGGLDKETTVRKLCRLLGALSHERSNVVRPQAQYELRSGWSTYQVRSGVAGETGVYVGMAAAVPVTMERLMAFHIARLVINKELCAALADSGVSVDVSGGFEMFPQEVYNVLISCRPVPSKGLPAGVEAASPDAVVPIVRDVLSRLASSPVSASDLKIYKNLLLKDMTYTQSLTRTQVDAVLTRYSEGKDLMSRYKDAISALTASQVQEVLSVFDTGSKVEYMVY